MARARCRAPSRASRAPGARRSRRSRSPTWSRSSPPPRRGSGRSRRGSRVAGRGSVAWAPCEARGVYRPLPSAVRRDRLRAAEPAAGRAAARAHGRAHAPRRPRGELLVPAPPGRLPLDRRSAAPACGWSTWRAARDTARPCWPSAPPRSSASTRTRRRTSTRACATARRTCASSAALVEQFDDGAPCDAIVFLQTIEHVHGARARCSSGSPSLLAPGGVAYVSTPNRLTLAPPGAERSGNPWHVREYDAGRVPRRCVEPRFASRRAARACSTRASCALHELALRLGWDRVHPALRLTQPLLRPVRAGDQRARLRAARRRRSTARSTCSRSAGRERPRSASDGELCIVLHSPHALRRGLRHVAVRRGVAAGGDRRLLPAADRPARAPRSDGARRPVATVGVTPVLADQLALPEVGERFLRFMRGTRRDCHRLDIAGLEQDGQHDAAAALRALGARLRVGGGRVRAARRRPARRASARLRDAGAIDALDLDRHARGAAAARDRAGRAASARGRASPRTGRASARWSGGLWLPECAYRPGLEEQLATRGRARLLRRPDRRRATRSTSSSRSRRPPGPVAVPIDWETIALVWDDARLSRRPASTATTTRQTINGLRPWANGGGAYDRDAAPRARPRARRATSSRTVAARAERIPGRPRAARACVVCALDTELLGHWWYEGLALARGGVRRGRRGGLALATLPAALERHEPRRAARCVESSWGAGKDLRTWDSPAVAEIVWPAREAELRLVGALGAGGAPPTARGRAAERAARELLALQSSDWAFMAHARARRRLSRAARPQPRGRVRATRSPRWTAP